MKKTLTTAIMIAILATGCNNKREANQESTDSTSVERDSAMLDPGKNANLDTVSLTSGKALALSDKAFEMMTKLANMYKTVEIDSVKYYVVEGDLLMDRDELYMHTLKLLNKDTAATKNNKLTIALTTDGSYAKWPSNYVIKYAVLKKSFQSTQAYQQAVADMREATTDWMKACNIQFEYVAQLDNGQVGSEIDPRLTFIVREFGSGGAFIAQAFFPTDPPYKRKILLDHVFFRMQESRSGVLRHELGHVLGFRHEHIWTKGTDCPAEQIIEDYLGASLIGTNKDCSSVMHYICGGCGSFEMKLSPSDIEGARSIYGPPLTN